MATVGNKHIYFLDDEPAISEVVKETLENSHIKVSCFESPSECLAQLQSNKCDLLISGLKMPGKDGIELLMDVKHLAPWIPVLMITGCGDIPTAVRAMQAGAVDFIEKPLAKEDFVQKIKSILQKNASAYSELGTPLTQQDLKILQLIVDGKSNKEIAHIFRRSICTIEYHRARIMHKLGVDNTIKLVKRAISMGLVDMEERQPQNEDKPDS